MSDITGWFQRRTFSADDRTGELVGRRRELDVTVSVVLPALNEAATIGGVVDAVMGVAGDLVDEVVVLDGGSDDGTAELAAAKGARVHLDVGVAPELGPALGKGDALWRSLAITSGDLVVFVDTDIRNPDPRFVTGLLGPLLVDPGIALVKGFYERPVELGGTLHPTGGGRVTELLARPLLNLLWPELAGLVQPLSGEYAGRRDLLEAIPFVTGYGVEVGMLIDTLLLRGADAIAQVDLHTRIHRNQSLDALSRMAFGIATVVLRRADEAGRLSMGALPTAYQQFVRDDTDTVQPLPPRHLEVIERPPMRTQRLRS